MIRITVLSFNFSKMEPQSFSKLIQLESVHTICKWLSQSDMSQARVFEVVNDVTALLNQKSITTLFNQLVNRMSSLGESEGNIKAYKQMINTLQHPFESIDTSHTCLQYLEKDLKLYFPPEQITIGTQKESKEHDNEMVADQENISYQFVPVRKLLKNFFEMPGVFESTNNYMNELENNKLLTKNVI